MDEVKAAAGVFMAARKLKPSTAKGYEALLGFYIGWYRGVDQLPPIVVVHLVSGRQAELVAMPEVH